MKRTKGLLLTLCVGLALTACAKENVAYNDGIPSSTVSEVVGSDTVTSQAISDITNKDTDQVDESEIETEKEEESAEDITIEDALVLSCEYDIDTILEILGKGYKPPFYCQLDHIDEAGNFVIHQYELVNNGDEAHTATVDWITVNPKTGECENYMGDRFNIEERK